MKNCAAESALKYARSVVAQELSTMQILGRDGHLIAISSTLNILEKEIDVLEQDKIVLKDKVFQLQRAIQHKEDYLQGILT